MSANSDREVPRGGANPVLQEHVPAAGNAPANEDAAAAPVNEDAAARPVNRNVAARGRVAAVRPIRGRRAYAAAARQPRDRSPDELQINFWRGSSICRARSRRNVLRVLYFPSLRRLMDRGLLGGGEARRSSFRRSRRSRVPSEGSDAGTSSLRRTSACGIAKPRKDSGKVSNSRPAGRGGQWLSLSGRFAAGGRCSGVDQHRSRQLTQCTVAPPAQAQSPVVERGLGFSARRTGGLSLNTTARLSGRGT
ncbi:unnamed protein product [Trichogramma brassicae]|uniref:Uncharacterized protein n=1 Tax=Trichogramma brassicae TaxID=86971 RepID=A0A6H5I0S6_9HYME|nr:unnamed protein product [Trichogramma brassicae]